MTISTLLKTFDNKKAYCDIVEICTTDIDLGCMLTIDEQPVQDILSKPQYVDYRIAEVKRWYFEEKYYAQMDHETHLIIMI